MSVLPNAKAKQVLGWVLRHDVERRIADTLPGTTRTSSSHDWRALWERTGVRRVTAP